MLNHNTLSKHIVNQSQIPTPKVSICIITYNHGNYIAKCLESIVCQKVNFTYEIIIGDDCSKDDTQKIISSFVNRYPHLFTVYFHPFNLGPNNNAGKNNFTTTFLASRGKYIVYIEGDDYFIDENKLQIQHDFLEKNKSFSACFHNAKIIWEDWADRPDEFVNDQNQKKVINTVDLLQEKEQWFMATASVMMRKSMILPLPKWFWDTVSGDIPMYILLAEKGPIGYIDKIMTVYRKNLGGQSLVYKLFKSSFILNRIQLYKNINSETKGKYYSLIKPMLSEYYFLLANSIEGKENSIFRLKNTLIGFYYQKIKSVKNFKHAFDKNVRQNQIDGIFSFLILLFKDFAKNYITNYDSKRV